MVEPAMTATVTASSFASALELVREGVIELQQHAAFAPILSPQARRIGRGRTRHHEALKKKVEAKGCQAWPANT